jgi:hypothetical protein
MPVFEIMSVFLLPIGGDVIVVSRLRNLEVITEHSGSASHSRPFSIILYVERVKEVIVTATPKPLRAHQACANAVARDQIRTGVQ